MPPFQFDSDWYTVSEALGTAAATASDFFAQGKITSNVLGTIAAIINGFKAHAFQGPIIKKTVAARKHPEYIAINMPEEENTPAADNPGGWQQYMAAGILNGSSAAFTLANRYFLVTSLCGLLSISIATVHIWAVILCCSAFKILFDLTNELYETNQVLATYINNGVKAKPVYANWRTTKLFLNMPGVRDVLAIVGTLEHSVLDDILPWLIFIPESALASLANAYRNFSLASVAAQAFAIIIPIVGGFLACVIIFQTILFEAEHSYEAYHNILNAKTATIKSLFDHLSPPAWALRLLQYALWLMPLCHGAATAAPVYVWMQKLFSLDSKGLFARASVADIFKSIGTVVIAVFAGLGTANGHRLSELKESQEILAEKIAQLPTITAGGHSVASLINSCSTSS